MTPVEDRPRDPLGGGTSRWPRPLLDQVNGIFAGRVDSTQSFARRLLDRHFREQETPRPFAIVAHEQSGGVGRRGRSWKSAPGLGVWASMAVPVESRQELQSVPMRTAVALAELVNELTGDRCRLKWPNDLVVSRRKLGGLLVDAVSRAEGSAWAVIGFGLNVGHGEAELPDPAATSLRLAAASPTPEVAALAGTAIQRIWRELESSRDWLDRYRSLTAHRSGDPLVCEVGAEILRGAFAGFDEHGFLQLDTGTGRRVVASGEVFSW